MKKVFYLSLVRELIGYAVKCFAVSESQVRQMAVDYYGKMWCSVCEKLPEGLTVIGYPVECYAYPVNE